MHTLTTDHLAYAKLHSQKIEFRYRLWKNEASASSLAVTLNNSVSKKKYATLDDGNVYVKTILMTFAGDMGSYQLYYYAGDESDPTAVSDWEWVRLTSYQVSALEPSPPFSHTIDEYWNHSGTPSTDNKTHKLVNGIRMRHLRVDQETNQNISTTDIREDDYFDITEHVLGHSFTHEEDVNSGYTSLPVMSLRLQNFEKDFNKRNSTSQYYGYFVKGARISCDYVFRGADWKYPMNGSEIDWQRRFTGEIDQILDTNDTALSVNCIAGRVLSKSKTSQPQFDFITPEDLVFKHLTMTDDKKRRLVGVSPARSQLFPYKEDIVSTGKFNPEHSRFNLNTQFSGEQVYSDILTDDTGMKMILGKAFYDDYRVDSGGVGETFEGRYNVLNAGGGLISEVLLRMQFTGSYVPDDGVQTTAWNFMPTWCWDPVNEGYWVVRRGLFNVDIDSVGGDNILEGPVHYVAFFDRDFNKVDEVSALEFAENHVPTGIFWNPTLSKVMLVGRERYYNDVGGPPWLFDDLLYKTAVLTSGSIVLDPTAGNPWDSVLGFWNDSANGLTLSSTDGTPEWMFLSFAWNEDWNKLIALTAKMEVDGWDPGFLDWTNAVAYGLMILDMGTGEDFTINRHIVIHDSLTDGSADGVRFTGITYSLNGDLVACKHDGTAISFNELLARHYFNLDNGNLNYEDDPIEGSEVAFSSPEVFRDKLLDTSGTVTSGILTTDDYELNLRSGEIKMLYNATYKDVILKSSRIWARYNHLTTFFYPKIEEVVRWDIINQISAAIDKSITVNRYGEVEIINKNNPELVVAYDPDGDTYTQNIKLGYTYIGSGYGDVVDSVNPDFSENTVEVWSEDFSVQYVRDTDYTVSWVTDHVEVDIDSGGSIGKDESDVMLVWILYRRADSSPFELSASSGIGDYSETDSEGFNKFSVVGNRVLPSNSAQVMVNRFVLAPNDARVQGSLDAIQEIDSAGQYNWNPDQDVVDRADVDPSEENRFTIEFQDGIVLGDLVVTREQLVYDDAVGKIGWDTGIPNNQASLHTGSNEVAYFLVEFSKLSHPEATFTDTSYEVVLPNTREWRVCTSDDFSDIKDISPLKRFSYDGSRNISNGASAPSNASDVATASHVWIKQMNGMYGAKTTRIFAAERYDIAYHVDDNGNLKAGTQGINNGLTNNALFGKNSTLKIRVLNENDQKLWEYHGTSGQSGYNDDYDTAITKDLGCKIRNVIVTSKGVNVLFDNWGDNERYLEVELIAYTLSKIENVRAHILPSPSEVDSEGEVEFEMESPLINNKNQARLISLLKKKRLGSDGGTIEYGGGKYFLPFIEVKDVVILNDPDNHISSEKYNVRAIYESYSVESGVSTSVSLRNQF